MGNKQIHFYYGTDERTVPSGTLLKAFLERENMLNPDIALVAVNNKEISKSLLETTAIREGDCIRLFYFLGDS